MFWKLLPMHLGSLAGLLLVIRLLLALATGLLRSPHTLLALGGLSLDLGDIGGENTGALVNHLDGDLDVLLADYRVRVGLRPQIRVGPKSDGLLQELLSQTRLTMSEGG